MQIRVQIYEMFASRHATCCIVQSDEKWDCSRDGRNEKSCAKVTKWEK